LFLDSAREQVHDERLRQTQQFIPIKRRDLRSQACSQMQVDNLINQNIPVAGTMAKRHPVISKNKRMQMNHIETRKLGTTLDILEEKKKEEPETAHS